MEWADEKFCVLKWAYLNRACCNASWVTGYLHTAPWIKPGWVTSIYVVVKWETSSCWGFLGVLLVIFTYGYCQREDKSKLLQLIWNIILTFLAEAKSNNILLADYLYETLLSLKKNPMIIWKCFWLVLKFLNLIHISRIMLSLLFCFLPFYERGHHVLTPHTSWS